MGIGRLAIGQIIKWNGEIYTLTGRAVNNKWRLQSLQFQDIREEHEDTLIAAYDNKELRFSDSGNATRQTDVGFNEYEVPGILQLSEELQKEVQFRYEVLKPLLLYIESGKGLSKAVDERVLELKKAGDELLGHKPPSRATIYRWIGFYRDSQGDWRSLIPNHQKPHTTQFPQQVEDIIDDVFEGVGGEKITVETLHALVEARILEMNESEGFELNVPSEATVYRRFKRQDPYEMERQRYGSEVAYNNHGNKKAGFTGEFPLDRVEVDHTPIDLLIVDHNGEVIGRKWLTSILDSKTRAVLGHHLGYEANATSILYALKNAIRSKSYVKSKYPFIEMGTNIFGVPKVIVTDLGRDFTSKHFENACKVIGIKPEPCPPHMPRFKGKIERFFSTICKGLFHQTPGTTLSNAAEKMRIKYQSEKKACITEEALDELVHLWIYGVYHKKKHRGALGVPNDLWERGMKGKPMTFPSDPDWELQVGKVAYGTIHPEGIRYQYYDYNSDELHLLRRYLIANSMPLKIMFVYDTDNLGHIRLFDPLKKQYIKVPCTDPAAEGLSEYLHQKIIASMNQQDKLNRAERSRARKMIVDMTMEEAAKSRKARRELKRMKVKGKGRKKKPTDSQTNKASTEIMVDDKPQLSLVPPRKPKTYSDSDWEGSTYARKIF